MNNKHTFKISQYPIREWPDPSVTTAAVQQFWQIKEYVNGEFRQLWGPFDSETAAAWAVKCLHAYFNRSLMSRGHGSNWWPSNRLLLASATGVPREGGALVSKRSRSASSRSFSCQDLRQVPGSRAFSELQLPKI
jgi:hypothetical protein